MNRRKKILVAGGAGYIGSRLIPELINNGYEVSVVDLLWFGNNLPTGIKIINKDIFSLVENDLEGFDIVLFLAGISNDPMAEYSPALNFISNSGSPAFLAFIAKKAGVKRFIYGSSCSVYGNTNNEIIDENSPAITLFPYGISKLQGEYGIHQLTDGSFSTITFRQGTLSGYSPRMRFDIFINTMYMKAATEGVITVTNPEIWRPVLSIMDAVDSYKAAIEANDDISGIFNIASVNVKIGDAANNIKEHFAKRHKKNISIENKNIFDIRNYKVSTDKAKKVLKIKFNGSINSILDDLDKNIGLNHYFENDNQYNIKVFESIIKEIKFE